MHTEINAAVGIVRTVARPDWSWDASELATNCRELTWSAPSRSDASTRVATNLRINRPEAFVHIEDGAVWEMMVWVSDIEEPDYRGPSPAVSGFEAILARIIVEFGEPSQDLFDEVWGYRWDLSNTVAFLIAREDGIFLDLVNPEVQKKWDA
ncbi:DUF6301 family protein [Nocardia sp. NPDC057668]|uniref:DUF6301 family protein n=1 Tax=Nocardia sp. NPDC057668 TaxID=3346202 RepID=UPI00366EF2EE